MATPRSSTRSNRVTVVRFLACVSLLAVWSNWKYSIGYITNNNDRYNDVLPEKSSHQQRHDKRTAIPPKREEPRNVTFLLGHRDFRSWTDAYAAAWWLVDVRGTLSQI